MVELISSRDMVDGKEYKAYEKLKEDINQNLDAVIDMADEYYGTIYNNIKKNEEDLERVLNERELFMKSTLESFNKLSLELLLKKLEEHKLER